VRAQLAALSPRALYALAVAAVLVYAAVMWFVLAAPKRSEAARLGDDVVAAELRLGNARLAARRPQASRGPVADVFRLVKAMPSSADESGLVLELARVAGASGVTLGSITPKEPVVSEGGATAIPVTVTLTGSYGEIARFLGATRALVTRERGKLRVTGRLLAVESIELVESSAAKFPTLDATITFDAYVYDGPLAPPTPPIPAPSEDATSSGATAARGRP